MKEIVRQYSGTVISSLVIVLLLALIYLVPAGGGNGVLRSGGEVAKEQASILQKEESYQMFDTYWRMK